MARVLALFRAGTTRTVAVDGYVMFDDFDKFEAADAASAFLSLVREKLRTEPEAFDP